MTCCPLPRPGTCAGVQEGAGVGAAGALTGVGWGAGECVGMGSMSVLGDAWVVWAVWLAQAGTGGPGEVSRRQAGRGHHRTWWQLCRDGVQRAGAGARRRAAGGTQAWGIAGSLICSALTLPVLPVLHALRDLWCLPLTRRRCRCPQSWGSLRHP